MTSSSVRAAVALMLVGGLVGCGEGNVEEGLTPSRDASTDTRTAPLDTGVATPPDTGAPDTGVGPEDVPVPLDTGVAPEDADDLTPDDVPDGGATAVDVTPPTPTTGGFMRVTASSLNLRSGPGTSNSILTSMPCGTQVTVLGGPTSGWWNIRYGTRTGWASGAYLVAESAYNASVCGGTTTPPPAGTPPEVSAFFDRARAAVGYSYWWGHGAWRTDGAEHGSCSGSCPSCSHSGRYGADCSGFVAKCWQIPGPIAVTTDAHPYSTYHFYNNSTHWSRVSRASVRAGDALVYNASGSGHIVLFERGTDPWGALWVYEARGCSYGIVHSNRSFGSTYVGIRRDGL